jgi:hypothetical protein
MSHSQRAKKAYANHLLRVGLGHAENGQFARRSTPATKKQLVASVTVRQTETETDQTLETPTLIEVMFLRDEANAKGGVNQLQTGDLYWRDVTFDSDQRPFSWTGEILEQGEHYTRAVFQRFNLVSQGKGVVS